MRNVEGIEESVVVRNVLVFDPGESTGWVHQDDIGQLSGGTLPRDHVKVAELISNYRPDVVVLERFNLYPGMAKHLSWNSFYPCEVIGVIKFMCMCYDIPVVEQAPSVKKYAGKLDEGWKLLLEKAPRTEHMKDAYQHLKYFLIHNKEGINK